MRRIACLSVLTACLLSASPAVAGPLDSLTLDVEAGPLAFLQNDNRYGASGTFYTADTVALSRNLFEARRFSGEARLFDRHTLILLYAPLDVTTRVTFGQAFTFRDTVFPAGAVVDHRYLFDALRASYLYRLYDGHGLTGELGATLQIRNAQVAVSEVNGARFAAEWDIGLVPALKGRVRYRTPEGVTAMLEADGSTTPGWTNTRGGILDTALTLGLPVREDAEAILRLRYLGGGADVPGRQIANWGQFFAATAGLRWQVVRPRATDSAPAPLP